MTEVGVDTIHLIDQLHEHSGFHTALFLGYGVDMAFFEEVILHPLWRNGCRNHLVMVDAKRYGDTTGDLRGSVTWVGRRYVLLPIALGPFQSFHPKLVMLLGRERGRLLLGSGNLTFTGFGHNHEVFTCLDWTPDETDLQRLFAEAWTLVKVVSDRWCHSSEADRTLKKAEVVADWLRASSEPVPSIQLFHTLDEPLIDQCSRALSGEDIERITVLSPFLDDGAHALREIYDRFRPQELRLVLQDQRTVGNAHALEALFETGVPLHAYRLKDDNRYLHAKVYVFETERGSYILTGSANCTRAAWLSTSAAGNVEIALLRRAHSPAYFTPFVESHIALDGSIAIADIALRQEQISLPEGDPAAIHLLDVSLDSGQLSGTFRVALPLDNVAELQLRLSTAPPAFITLEAHGVDAPRAFHIPIAPELREALRHAASVSVWGVDPEGERVDLRCNELWITNVDALHRERRIVSTDFVRASVSLGDMLVSSENEWRDLYGTLIELVELDVAQVKRRKGTPVPRSSSEKTEPQPDGEEGETVIRVVGKADDGMPTPDKEETRNALARESEFSGWFEYVRSRLPGSARGQETDAKRPSGSSEGKRRGRKWTPSQRIGRRFLNLVKKYIRSLNNIEYMQTPPILHTLAYYVVFQRIVWLLLEHNVIDEACYVQFVVEINTGFFGSYGEVPALCPRLRRHLSRTWHEEWRTSEVHLYALASVLLSEDLVRRHANRELEDRVSDRSLQVLSGVATVMNSMSWADPDSDALARIAEVFDQDALSFAIHAEERLHAELPSIAAALDEWVEKTTINLMRTDSPRSEMRLRQARVEYGQARYGLLSLLHDTKAQIELCSDMVFWTGVADDPNGAREWEDKLVTLLLAQGETHDVAQALFCQGKNLFYHQHYAQCANRLRQSMLLAERLGDDTLVGGCRQYLGYLEFFLR